MLAVHELLQLAPERGEVPFTQFGERAEAGRLSLDQAGDPVRLILQQRGRRPGGHPAGSIPPGHRDRERGHATVAENTSTPPELDTWLQVFPRLSEIP